MQALCLSNNGLTTLPKTLFRSCIELSTLDLHGTEITIDLLRQVHNILSDKSLHTYNLITCMHLIALSNIRKQDLDFR